MKTMDSKKSLGLVGVLSVIALIAAIWMVARPSQVPLPAQTAADDVAPVASHADRGDHDTDRTGKMTLQFYRNPPAVADLTMTDLDGRSISTASLKGKVVIINFWATWCPPCRAEIPDLIKLQAKYKDQLQIIGVSDDDDPPAVVKKWANEHGMNYPIVMSNDQLRKAFVGVSALPTSFILNRESKMMIRHVGMLQAPVTEAETRHLAGMPVDVTVEEIDKDDKPAKLANALQVTEIPGIDLSKLTKEQRIAAITKLNDEPCTCGCNQTLARCRVDDPGCPVSLPRAKELLAGLTAN
jgi:thiol-disulfide isomerase/thioredoxin